MKNKLFNWTLIIWGFCAIFITFGLLWSLSNTISILDNSEKTVGTVKDFVLVSGGDNSVMCPEIGFVVKGGESYTFISGACGLLTRDFFEGQSLEVIYNVNNPRVASINSFIFMWGYTLFLLFFSVLSWFSFIIIFRKKS
jgi:hypothetical protein